MEIQNKIKENVKKETKERIYYQEKRCKEDIDFKSNESD